MPTVASLRTLVEILALLLAAALGVAAALYAGEMLLTIWALATIPLMSFQGPPAATPLAVVMFAAGLSGSSFALVRLLHLLSGRRGGGVS